MNSRILQVHRVKLVFVPLCKQVLCPFDSNDHTMFPICVSLVFSRTWSVTRRRYSAPSCAAWRLTPWKTPSTSSTAIPMVTEPPSSRQTARRRGSTRSWSTSGRYVGPRVCSHWDENEGDFVGCHSLDLAARFNAHKKTCHILRINCPPSTLPLFFLPNLCFFYGLFTLPDTDSFSDSDTDSKPNDYLDYLDSDYLLQATVPIFEMDICTQIGIRVRVGNCK